MRYMVVYDTDDDHIRGAIRETLKDMGGDHVQYSAFLITLDSEETLRLVRLIQEIIFGSDTDVRIIPICKKDLQRMEVYSTENEADVTDIF